MLFQIVQSMSGGPYKIRYKETVTVISSSRTMISLNMCSKNGIGEQEVIIKSATAASNKLCYNSTTNLKNEDCPCPTGDFQPLSEFGIFRFPNL